MGGVNLENDTALGMTVGVETTLPMNLSLMIIIDISQLKTNL